MDRWECLREWKDDALPDFGPFEIDEQKEGMVFWDLRLTNYSHDLWPHLLKEKGNGASSSGDHGQGGCGVHLGSSSSTDQGRVGEGQAADTHTSQIQFPWDKRARNVDGLGTELLVQRAKTRGTRRRWRK